MSSNGPSNQPTKEGCGQAKRWCFTLNNPESDRLFGGELPPGARYLVYQLEKGATPHFQGYIAFSRNKRFGAVKAMFPNGVHLEQARGTEGDNTSYCSKAETRMAGPFILGETVEQGSRTDLSAIAEEVKKSGSLEGVPPLALLRYSRGLCFLQSMQQPPRRKQIHIVTIIAPSNVGKTTGIFDRIPDAFRPVYGNNGIWWNGYQGQSTIFFDEFEGSGQVTIARLLQMLDPFPYQLETKGSFVPAKYTTVLICSNKNPDWWYQKEAAAQPGQFRALQRRINAPTNHFFQLPEDDAGIRTDNDRGLIQKFLDEAIGPKPPDISKLSLADSSASDNGIRITPAGAVVTGDPITAGAGTSAAAAKNQDSHAGYLIEPADPSLGKRQRGDGDRNMDVGALLAAAKSQGDNGTSANEEESGSVSEDSVDFPVTDEFPTLIAKRKQAWYQKNHPIDEDDDDDDVIIQDIPPEKKKKVPSSVKTFLDIEADSSGDDS